MSKNIVARAISKQLNVVRRTDKIALHSGLHTCFRTQLSQGPEFFSEKIYDVAVLMDSTLLKQVESASNTDKWHDGTAKYIDVFTGLVRSEG